MSTKIADVVIPEIFAEYLMEPILVKNAMFDSGMVTYDALLASKLDRGGQDFKFPYWGALDNDALEVPKEDIEGTVNKITTGQLTVPRQFRSFNAGADKFASILAGSNAMDAIAVRVQEAWKKGLQTTLVATLEGILTTAGAGLVNDVAAPAAGADPTVANNISAEAIIDAQALLGDQGGKFVAIMMHSKVLAELRKLNLISYEPLADQDQMIPFYQDMRVIVDDRMYNFNRTAASTDAFAVYTTFVLKESAFKYGDSESGFKPVHIEEDETTGVGKETLYTRKMFALHPNGFSWIGTPAAEEGPTDAELRVDTNWELKYDINTSGFVALYTNAV